MTQKEDIAELCACAQRFAALLRLPAPRDTDIESKIRHVLYDRHAVAAAAAGILTRTEAVDLMLDHLHDLICDRAGTEVLCDDVDDQLRSDVECAMFGRSR